MADHASSSSFASSPEGMASASEQTHTSPAHLNKVGMGVVHGILGESSAGSERAMTPDAALAFVQQHEAALAFLAGGNEEVINKLIEVVQDGGRKRASATTVGREMVAVLRSAPPLPSGLRPLDKNADAGALVDAAMDPSLAPYFKADALAHPEHYALDEKTGRIVLRPDAVQSGDLSLEVRMLILLGVCFILMLAVIHLSFLGQERDP
jgi:hypothetical protein